MMEGTFKSPSTINVIRAYKKEGDFVEEISPFTGGIGGT
jgi:hypothetical protein